MLAFGGGGRRMRKMLLLYAATVLVLMGCSTYTPMASSYGPGATSDSDIAAIMTAANQGEIDQANVAVTKATSADVRNFAQMMVTDHTNALNAANSLFSSRNITPSDNNLSSTLKSGSQQTVSALNTYSGSSFDRTYMQAQVDAHQWLLTTLDNNLIPSAQSRAVHDLLTSQRGTVASHLDRARQILNGLPQ
jgi:putative membrane protein